MTNEQDRRELYHRTVRSTMSLQPRDQRHVTVTWRSESDDILDVWVIVDGTTHGIFELSVYTASVSEAGRAELNAQGFLRDPDDEDERFTVYKRTISSATVADIVTFIEWSMISVSGAPIDYTPGIRTGPIHGAAGPPKGCFGSLLTVVKMIFLVIAGSIALAWLLS
jgi:hypothetical protein